MDVLEVRDSSGGYNTREEPRALAVGECLELVNAFPGSPSPIPRPGCSHWGRGAKGLQTGRSGNLIEIIPFRLSSNSYILEVMENEVRAYREVGRSGEVYQVKDASGTAIPGCPTGTIICYDRVDDAIVCGSTDPSWSWIFEVVDDVVVARSTNISRPDSFISIQDSNVTGSILPGWYRYTWTFINRGDRLAENVLDQYTPGKLESWEDSSQRVTRQVPAGITSLQVRIDWTEDPDPQVTHVRVYRTDAAISEDTVSSLTPHWVGDLAIPDAMSHITFIDSVAVSEGDYSPETTDLSDLPPTGAMKYHNGRMWIGGDRGVFFFSRPFASTSVSALKSVTMFRMDTDFRKVASDSTERAMAIGVANNDLYLNTDRSVGYLPDGDPDANAVKTISSTLGTPFYRTMTEWDQVLCWMSPVGPVMAQNGYVDKMEKFKAGEVWLFAHNPNGAFQKGFFHDESKVKKGDVVAFRYMSTWWISGGGKTIGFHESDDKRVRGALSVAFADPEMRIDRVGVVDSETVVFDRISRPAWTSGSRTYPWRFLNQSWNTDAGFFMTVKQTFRRLYFDKDPSKVCEPFDLTLYAKFTDNGELRANIRGDLERIPLSFRYEERPKTAHQQHQDAKDATRFTLQQAIPAVGARASFYDISWAKIMRPPFDFSCWGARLRVVPRRGIPNDSVSISTPDEIPLDKGLAVLDGSSTIGATT